MRTQASTKVPQASAHRNRQTHPTTIVLCKSWSSQAALEPREHTTVMEEAYNSGTAGLGLRQGRGGQAPADPTVLPSEKVLGRTSAEAVHLRALREVRGVDVVKLSAGACPSSLALHAPEAPSKAKKGPLSPPPKALHIFKPQRGPGPPSECAPPSKGDWPASFQAKFKCRRL